MRCGWTCDGEGCEGGRRRREKRVRSNRNGQRLRKKEGGMKKRGRERRKGRKEVGARASAG